MRLNQSTSKNKSRKKIYAIIAIVILALGFVSLGLLYGNYKYNWFNTVKSPSDVNLKPTTEEQKNNGDSIKEESVQGKPNAETPNQGSTDNATQASSVDVTITSPTTQSINNFSVRAFIDKLTTDGQCTLVLTNASIRL